MEKATVEEHIGYKLPQPNLSNGERRDETEIADETIKEKDLKDKHENVDNY
jgi:hypothetical protein